MYDSRRSRVQEKRMTRKGIFFLFASIALVILLFMMGIPTLVKLTGFVGSLSSNSTITSEDDKTAPGSPQFEPIPQEYVQTPSITLKGRAEVGSTLKIYKNENAIKETLIDESGSFSLEINLSTGENILWLTATDSNGNTSENSTHAKVIYDTDAPLIELLAPEDGASFYGSDKNINVEGTTQAKTKIIINDRVAIVSASGKFTQKVGLNEGLNAITIIARDDAGNESEKKITVSYQP